MTRNDNRLREDISMMFAMYCDENGLAADQCFDLADEIGEELQFVAGDRVESADAP